MPRNAETATTARLGRVLRQALILFVVVALPIEVLAADPKPAKVANPQLAAAQPKLAQATPAAVPETAPAPVLSETPSAAPAPAGSRPIGAHVGVATPLVTVSKETTTIGDQFTVLNPIGIG